MKDEEILSNSFYEARIILKTKPNQEITKKRKLQTNIPHERRHENP